MLVLPYGELSIAGLATPVAAGPVPSMMLPVRLT